MTKSKHYYDYTRNCSCGGVCESSCGSGLCRKIGEADINKDIDVRSYYKEGNFKIRNDVEEKEDISVPSYYIGNNGYEARKVISGFDLSYNVGTATTYLLRCGKKTEQGMSKKDKHIEDIEKAMNHLRFELERLRDEH